MAGHSKWANIKRKKGVTDQKRAVIFTKLSRLITMAVIEGGGIGDPNLNVRLRLAIEKAKAENMPKDGIQRAIDKGAGPNKEALQEVVYEAFGPHGSALIVKATTDNTNRSVAEIRNLLERNGGKMGSQGTVAYLFQHCASAIFEKATNPMDSVFTFAEQVEAFDIQEEEDVILVYFPYEQLGKMRDYAGEVQFAQVPDEDYKPVTEIQLGSEGEYEQLQNLIELLEERDDVQNVYTNAVFSKS